MSGPKVYQLSVERQDHIARLQARLERLRADVAELMEEAASYQAQKLTYFENSSDPVMVKCQQAERLYQRTFAREQKKLRVIAKKLEKAPSADAARDHYDQSVMAYDVALGNAAELDEIEREMRREQLERADFHARHMDYGQSIAIGRGVLAPPPAPKHRMADMNRELYGDLLRDLHQLAHIGNAGATDEVTALLEELESARALTNSRAQLSRLHQLSARVHADGRELRKKSMRREALWRSAQGKIDTAQRLTDAELDAIAAPGAEDPDDADLDFIRSSIHQVLTEMGHAVLSGAQMDGAEGKSIYDYGDGKHGIVLEYRGDGRFMLEVCAGEGTDTDPTDAERAQRAFCDEALALSIRIADRGVRVHGIEMGEDKAELRREDLRSDEDKLRAEDLARDQIARGARRAQEM